MSDERVVVVWCTVRLCPLVVPDGEDGVKLSAHRLVV